MTRTRTFDFVSRGKAQGAEGGEGERSNNFVVVADVGGPEAHARRRPDAGEGETQGGIRYA
jgi:hypothetical protein